MNKPETQSGGSLEPVGSAAPRIGQCECCASPLGEAVTVDGVTKIVCDKCLGFIARWLIEMEQQNAEVSDGGGHQAPECANRHRPPPFAPPKS